MPIPKRSRYIGDEDELQIWWFISGQLVDFSTGYTFVASVANSRSPQTIIFTKTNGFTGSAGSGIEGDGTPNLIVQWATSGELNSITTPGTYILEIKATLSADGSETTQQMLLQMASRLGS